MNDAINDTANASAEAVERTEAALVTVLQDNLVALAETHPDFYRNLSTLFPTLSIAFVPYPTASVTVSDGARAGTVALLPDAAVMQSLTQINNRKSVCLLFGMGCGHELGEIHRRTERPRLAALASELPIYVVEPDPLALIAGLCGHDVSAAIRSGRILFWTGADAVDGFLGYVSNNRQAMVPARHVNLLPASAAAFVSQALARINALLGTMAQRTEQLEQRVTGAYADKTIGVWRDIFRSGGRPLRILGCTSLFTTFIQHCMRDLLAGFEQNGCSVRLHKEQSPIERITQYDLLATVDEFQPDLIITIDHFRDEFPYLPRNLPFVNWIQDLLPNIVNPEQLQLGELDFTFVFAPQWVDTLSCKPCYAGHPIDVLPLGINADIYHPVADGTPQFDVLYVSHLVDPLKTLRPMLDPTIGFEPDEDESLLLHDRLIGYEQLILVYMLMTQVFDGLLIDDLWKYIAEPPTRRAFVRRILAQAEVEPSEAIFRHFCTSQRIHNDIGYAIKTRPLIALVNNGIDVRIYGNNWAHVPQLRDCAYGPVDNGAALNRLMQQARICLNNSPGTSLHMRAVEILAAGRFMLSRQIVCDSSDIKLYLKPDEDIVFFSNEIDIVSTTKRWLADHAGREHMALAAHKKATQLFGYDRIAGQVLNTVSSRLASASRERGSGDAAGVDPQ